MTSITLRFKMRFWFAVASCWAMDHATAQQQFLQFDKTYGGLNDESCADMIPGSDGGFLLVGSTGSYGPGAADGNENGYVVKVDAQGEAEWQFALGGGGQDFFGGAAQTSTGDYLIMGQRVQSENMVLVRVAPDGMVLWCKEIGSVDRSEAADIILALGQDEFVVVGARGNNVFALWIDADGDIQQAAEFACAPSIQARGVAIAADGTLLISGGYTNLPFQHALLLKVAMDGALLWGRIYQQLEHSSYHHDLLPTQDGGCFVAGTGGDSDATITRIDASGNVVWRRGYAGSDRNQCRNLLQYGTDRLIATMYMFSEVDFQAPSTLLLLDTLGNLIDQVTFGPTSDDLYSLPNSSATDTGGGCLSAGQLRTDTSNSDMRLIRIPVADDNIDGSCSAISLTVQEISIPPLTFGPIITALDPPVLTSATLSWSPVVVTGSQTICSNVGIGDAPITAMARCFPNPARDVLHFDLPLASLPLRATISDATGRSCSAGPLSAQNDLVIGHLSLGVYHCRLECANGERFALRFVVE